MAVGGAIVAARMIVARFLAMFFPTPLVGFPFVLKGAPPVADHRIRRILSAIRAVIPEHAGRHFNFRADRRRVGVSAIRGHPAIRFSQIVGRFVTEAAASFDVNDG